MTISPDSRPRDVHPASPSASPSLTTELPDVAVLPRCQCGHDRQHAMARPEPKYGVGGWLRLMIGVSAKPQRMVYRCRRCHSVIDESTAAEALDKSY